MILSDLRSLHDAEPFVPFLLDLCDGSQLFVCHREHLELPADGELAVVYDHDGGAREIALADIESASTDEEAAGTIEIDLEPRADVLEALGVGVEEFVEALEKAIDDFHQTIEEWDENEGEPPSIHDTAVYLRGRTHPLSSVCEIVISGDVDGLEE